ncbi:hypothetical protein GCM10022226_13750 [Sphaerisporangium flaviroseum]|uniref:Uncharacterized protein n=1 Tax=Sphaerisporangium flaviroseum TaxID=509199 RepID=A0ABP7HI88_9ACTN
MEDHVLGEQVVPNVVQVTLGDGVVTLAGWIDVGVFGHELPPGDGADLLGGDGDATPGRLSKQGSEDRLTVRSREGNDLKETDRKDD